MKAGSLKTCYARDASTALDWSIPRHRAVISENLRTNAEVLAAEYLNTTTPGARMAVHHQMQRVYMRLAVCDMVAAREAEQALADEKKRDTFCRITLEHMADAFDNAVTAYPLPDDAPLSDAARQRIKSIVRVQLDAGKRLANTVVQHNLENCYTTGPYAGLGRLAQTAGRMELKIALKVPEAFSAMCGMARAIPVDTSPDAQVIQAQMFRDGLKLLRRDLGMDNEDRES
jgi:hypothetical protein